MVDEVKVQITVEEKQALAALTKLTRAVDGVGDEAKRTGKEVDSLGKKLKNTGAVFAGAFGAGVALRGLSALQGAMGQVVDEAIQFDKSIREINTLLPKNAKLTKELQKELKGIASQFATTDASQAKAYYQIVSAGTAEGAEATKLLAQANTLALGGLSDVGSSINILTDILNVYGTENLTAQEAADSLFQTVKLGKTNIESLSSSLGAVIPSAKNAGLELDSVNAALATLTTQGLTTSENVTQLRSLLNALAKNAKKLSGTTVEAKLKANDFQGALEELATITGRSSTKLFELLGRGEAVQAVLRLTGDQTQTLTSNLESFRSKAGAAATAAGEMQKSLEFRRDKATKDIKAIGDSIVNFLLPHIESSVRGIKALQRELDKDKEADAISDTAEEVKDLEEQIDRTTKKIEFWNNTLATQKEYGMTGAMRGTRKEIGLLTSKLDILKEKQLEFIRLDEMRKFTQAEAPATPKGEAPDGTGGSGGLDAKNQKRIDDEAKVQAEIALLRETAGLNEEEQRLRVDELQSEETDKNLERLNEIEIEKLLIAEEAELKKAALIKDSKQRQLAEEKIHNKTNAQIQKAAAKQELEAEKKLAADKKAIRAANFQSASRFLQAGLTLAKEGSSAQRVLATADATINTYVAANKAFASVPYPANIAAMISTIALGLANVAKINGVGFQNGGVVGGFVGATGGPDNVQATVRTGEMILNAAQQRNLFDQINAGEESSRADNLQDSIQALANQDIVIQVDSKEIARATREASRDGFRISA